MKINYKKWGIILGIIVVLIISANLILSSIISNIVVKRLEKMNEKGEVALKFDDISVDIFSSNLNIKGISIKPDSLYFEKFKLGETNHSTEATFELSKLKIRGFNIFKILLFKEINLRKIEAQGIEFTLYKSDKYIEDKSLTKEKEDVKLDSIYIKGINEIGLGEILIDELNIKIIHAQSSDTLFMYSENECAITGIGLEAYKDTLGLFEFKSNNFNVNLKKQQFDLKTGNYSILFDEINYNYEEAEIKINDFKFYPTKDKFKLAKSYTYNNEIFEVETKNITLTGFDLDRAILRGEVSIDSVIVEGLNLSIFKDQTKPFNLNKRPKFLNETLKNTKFPFNIESIVVNDSHFLYQEKLPETKNLMTIAIADINASINNVTTIKDSLLAKQTLDINLKGKMNNVAPINLDIYLPYITYNNSFSFSGKVGSAKFSDFNSAIFPALGAKVESGMIDRINFSVNGTPYGTSGTMTMLYHGLSADFFKASPKHKGKKSKALSWMANSIVHSQNPTQKGKILIALIEFKRVPYKGFGNVIWKSFMSGLVNTVSPVGKTVKESKELKNSRKGTHREMKKAQ